LLVHPRINTPYCFFRVRIKERRPLVECRKTTLGAVNVLQDPSPMRVACIDVQFGGFTRGTKLARAFLQ
jgi:hypothetical protein